MQILCLQIENIINVCILSITMKKKTPFASFYLILLFRNIYSTRCASRYKSFHSSELTLASLERAYPTCTVHWPERTFRILCTKVSAILKVPQGSDAIHAWRNGWSIVDCVQLENTSTVLAARRKICLISWFQIFRLEEKTFFVVGVHRPVVALVRSSSAQVCASLRICQIPQCKVCKSDSTICRVLFKVTPWKSSDFLFAWPGDDGDKALQ